MSKMLIIFFLIISINVSADLVSDGLATHYEGNYAKAHMLYAEACQQGNTKGCLSLGSLYALGHGVKINIEIAKKFFKKACDGGNERGCVNFDAMNLKPKAK